MRSYVLLLNNLFYANQRDPHLQQKPNVSLAQHQILTRLFALARDEVRDRRDFGSISGHATEELVKQTKRDDLGYTRLRKGPTQVPLIASRVVEPCDNGVVHLLEVLPEEEAQYYAREENVLEEANPNRYKGRSNSSSLLLVAAKRST